MPKDQRLTTSLNLEVRSVLIEKRDISSKRQASTSAVAEIEAPAFTLNPSTYLDYITTAMNRHISPKIESPTPNMNIAIDLDLIFGIKWLSLLNNTLSSRDNCQYLTAIYQ